MSSPGEPTKEERSAHEATHMPFRSWCRHCVRGRGVAAPHRIKKKKDKEAEESSPKICIDSAFLGKEDEEANRHPIIVMHDKRSKAVAGIYAGKKGVVEWVGKWVTEVIEDWGYGNMSIIMKSDQENAIKALKKHVAEKRVNVETIMEESPKKDSASNGAVERAIRTWAGQFRTIKDAYEFKSGMSLKVNEPITTWMMLWTGEVLDKYKEHDNGRTSYENRKGRKWVRLAIPFGEAVLFRILVDKTRRNKFTGELRDGIVLGVKGRTSEYYV